MKQKTLLIMVTALCLAGLAIALPTAVCGQSLTGTFDVLDTMPPAAVTDLRILGYTETTVTLAWTAPGDDDLPLGSAAAYDLRYAPFAITAQNWGLATPVAGEPIPGTCGTTERFTITGLDAAITYYFALKAADEVPNWSPISNVVSRPGSPAPGGGGGGGGGGIQMPVPSPTVRPTPRPTSSAPTPEPFVEPTPSPTSSGTEPAPQPVSSPTPQMEPTPEPESTPLELNIRTPKPTGEEMHPAATREDRTWLWAVIGATAGSLAAVFTFGALRRRSGQI